MQKTITPKQSMSEFFARADVKRLQDIQKANPYGSEAHRKAYAEIVTLAKAVGAESFFGEY